MRLSKKNKEDRIYALRHMIGGGSSIEIINEDIVNENISFDILNDQIDYINHVSREDIDYSIDKMIDESNCLDGDNRICFMVDNIFIKDDLFKDYIKSLNDFCDLHNITVDIVVESSEYVQSVPIELNNSEIWYGSEKCGKLSTQDQSEEFLGEYVDSKRLFETGLKKYLTCHTPNVVIASTPITILALDAIVKDSEVRGLGLINFGNIYNFEKHGVFRMPIFENYFIKVLSKTTIPLAVESASFADLVRDIIKDPARDIVNLPSPNYISEDLSSLADSNFGIFIEDNDHISDDDFSKMFSTIAPIGLSLTISTSKERSLSINKLLEDHYIGKCNFIFDKDSVFYNFLKKSHKAYMDFSKDSSKISKDIIESDNAILNKAIDIDSKNLVDVSNTIGCIKKIITLIGNPYLKSDECTDVVKNYSSYVKECWKEYMGDDYGD